MTFSLLVLERLQNSKAVLTDTSSISFCPIHYLKAISWQFAGPIRRSTVTAK
jgi:hypothetical protein